MDHFEIKIVENDEELEIFRNMTTYAFGKSPSRSSVDDSDDSEPDYFKSSYRYILYDNGKPTSTLHSIPMTQNVRGKIFPMQGIAAVSTYPEHRRKGNVRALMKHTLKIGKREGQVFSTLYPFRESFYGEFGYINFPQARIVDIAPQNLKDVLNFTYRGKIERYLVGNQIDRYYAFLKKMQVKRHGWGIFNREQEQKMEKSKNWVVFAIVDGDDIGLLLYSTTGFEQEMKVSFFGYMDSNAKYLLLDYLHRHQDQFSKISLRIFADEHPETWIYDGKLKIKNRKWVPSPMGRILDVSALSGLEAGMGEISIRITDEYCQWNDECWRFRGDNNYLTVKLNHKPDLEMSIQGLSALVFGCYEIDDLVSRGWLSTSDYNQTLLELFPPQIPVLFSIF